MKRIQPALILWFLLPVAAGVAPAAPAEGDCRTVAAALRERLEAVTEAVIDGRRAAVPGAANRAQTWWRSHRAAVGPRAQADSLLALMNLGAIRHRPLESARLAVLLSVQSLEWCPGAPGSSERLMLVDLAGMTGWLRARGARLDWPGDAPGAADELAGALEARGAGPMAARLRRAMAATLATPERVGGDVRPAVRLLDLVDEMEKVLR